MSGVACYDMQDATLIVSEIKNQLAAFRRLCQVQGVVAKPRSLSALSWSVCGAQIGNKVAELEELLSASDPVATLSVLPLWIQFAKANLNWAEILEKLAASHEQPVDCTPLKAEKPKSILVGSAILRPRPIPNPIVIEDDDEVEEKPDKMDIPDDIPIKEEPGLDKEEEELVLPFKKGRPTELENILGALRKQEQKIEHLQEQVTKQEHVVDHMGEHLTEHEQKLDRLQEQTEKHENVFVHMALSWKLGK